MDLKILSWFGIPPTVEALDSGKRSLESAMRPIIARFSTMLFSNKYRDSKPGYFLIKSIFKFSCKDRHHVTFQQSPRLVTKIFAHHNPRFDSILFSNKIRVMKQIYFLVKSTIGRQVIFLKNFMFFPFLWDTIKNLLIFYIVWRVY